jgi:hypothetical protein
MKTKQKPYGRLFFELPLEDCIKLNRLVSSGKFKSKAQFLKQKIREEILGNE